MINNGKLIIFFLRPMGFSIINWTCSALKRANAQRNTSDSGSVL